MWNDALLLSENGIYAAMVTKKKAVQSAAWEVWDLEDPATRPHRVMWRALVKARTAHL